MKYFIWLISAVLMSGTVSAKPMFVSNEDALCIAYFDNHADMVNGTSLVAKFRERLIDNLGEAHATVQITQAANELALYAKENGNEKVVEAMQYVCEFDSKGSI